MKALSTLILLLLSLFPSFSQTKIQLEKKGGIYLIPCKINGINLKFIFDTGASVVTISLSEAVFMLKNGYLDAKDLVGSSYSQLANGNIQKGTNIILRRIEIGDKVLKDVKANIVSTLDAPLLLGQSALEKLGGFYFDYSKSALVFSDDQMPLKSSGCVSGDCINGTGLYIYENGDKYNGKFTNGKITGRGIYYFSSGGRLIGVFLNGELNGLCTVIYANGDTYEGNSQNGKRSGKGKFLFADSSIYEGSFNNDKYTGQGKHTTSDGVVYEGQFSNNELNGSGKITNSNGDYVFGNFKDGKLNGKGEMVNKDGSKYKGDFKNNQFAFGTLTENDGWVYEGNFIENRLQGRGKMSHKDWGTSTGEFKNGKLEGNGETVYVNGNKFIGEYKEGKISGYGKLTDIEGTSYEGQFDNYTFVKGHVEYSSGDVYDGNFNAEWKPEGKGKLTQRNRILEGDFKDGVLDGKGKIVYDDKSIFEGIFRNGEPRGLCKITFSSGGKYEGDVKDNFCSGSGTFTDFKGNKFSGRFNEILESDTAAFIFRIERIFEKPYLSNCYPPIEEVKKFTMKHPENVDGFFFLASGYLDRKTYDSAEMAFLKLLSFNKDDLYSLEKLEYINSILGNKDKTIKYAFKSLDILERNNGDPAEIGLKLNNIAYCYLTMKDYTHAKEFIDKAMLLIPKESLIWGTKGEFYFEMEDYRKCIKCMEKSIELENNSRFHSWSPGSNRYIQGISYIKLGDKIKGCEELRIADKQGSSEAYDAILIHCNK